MAEVKWIKIVTDVFDDEKILLIESLPESDSLIVIWFKLLCLAGKQNNSGVFLMNNKIPYTEEMLAAIFRRPLNTVKLALKTFEEFGMVEIVDGVITLPNWQKHQSLDKLEMIKEQTRKRVAKHRERQKEKALGLPETTKETECNVTCNVTVTQSNADRIRIDKDIDIDKEIDIDNINSKKERKKRTTVFTPPTLEEVIAYCNERNSTVDPLAFYDYFTVGNWIDNKGNKVKNWKQKIITWEKHQPTKVRNQYKQQSGNMFFDLLREEGKME